MWALATTAVYHLIAHLSIRTACAVERIAGDNAGRTVSAWAFIVLRALRDGVGYTAVVRLTRAYLPPTYH